MKIGVYLTDRVSPSDGGNFSYYDKMIEAIDRHQFNSALDVCFVGRFDMKPGTTKRPYTKLSGTGNFRFYQKLKKTGVPKLVSRLTGADINFSNRNDIATLRRDGIDLVLFPKQFLREIDNFPFMTMNWDAAHKSTYSFPEFVEYYELRDHWYRIGIQQAMAVIVESEASRREFAQFFAIPDMKLGVVPIFAGGVVDLKVDRGQQEKLLAEFNVKPLQYFYYPAQFWAHKNHVNLVIAFSKLVSDPRAANVQLVLSGADKDNKDHVISMIDKYGVRDRVVLLKFISTEAVYSLYSNAVALVMPTFLGPTNMPLLEAMHLNCPVICSDLEGHREMCADGALYASPTEPDKWAQAMAAVLDGDFRSSLLERANRVKERSVFNINSAVKALEDIFMKFEPVRRTFK